MEVHERSHLGLPYALCMLHNKKKFLIIHYYLLNSITYFDLYSGFIK